MSLLTTAKVSEMTGLPESTLRYFRHTDQGPRSGKLGRRVVYRAEDVQEWIEAEMNASTRGGTSPEAA